MGKKDLEMITATGIDPGAMEALIGGAKRNRAAQSKKQRYDQQRIRVRLDMPEPIKDVLVGEAKQLGTSVTDLGTFLLVYALALWIEENEDLHDLYVSQASRNPKKDVEVVLEGVVERLQKAVAKVAKTLPSAKEGSADGADDGPIGWGHWENA